MLCYLLTWVECTSMKSNPDCKSSSQSIDLCFLNFCLRFLRTQNHPPSMWKLSWWIGRALQERYLQNQIILLVWFQNISLLASWYSLINSDVLYVFDDFYSSSSIVKSWHASKRKQHSFVVNYDTHLLQTVILMDFQSENLVKIFDGLGDNEVGKFNLSPRCLFWQSLYGNMHIRSFVM